MVVTFIAYQKLEKVELDGFMGRWDSQKVESMYLQFTKYMENMVSISYDPLDLLNEVNNSAFLEDYEFYLKMANNVDMRLAAISKTCFENSYNLMTFHKVNSYRFRFNSNLFDRK